MPKEPKQPESQEQDVAIEDGEAEQTERATKKKAAQGPSKRLRKKAGKKPKITRANRFAKRPFPSYSAEEALAIPQVIIEKHGGNPMAPAEVAHALSLTKNSTRFFYLASAARDYGFTEGSRDTPKISVTPRGTAALRPKDERERQSAISEAVNSIELFQKVREFYKGGPLPEDVYLSNVLVREFGVDPKYHSDFRSIFDMNAKYIDRRGQIKSNRPEQSIGELSNSKDFVQFGETSFPRTAFVAMPFSEKGARPRPAGFFNQVIRSLITPAVIGAEFNVITAERRGSDIIQATIVRQLIAADLVIVDLTDHNPNVLFELGIRIAIGKPIVLIRTKDTGAIFDVDNMLRVFPYNENLWPTTLADDVPRLTAFVRAAWDDRETTSHYMQVLAGENWKANLSA